MYSLFFLYLSEQIYKIMKIKLLLISFLLAANALGAAAQVSKTYYVSKPGTLISMMTEEEANSVTHLTLTGKLNAEDFRHLRDEFANLKVLDISNAEIKMYSGKAGTYPNGKFYIYMPNFIPAYAFSNVVGGVTKGKATLEKVILSEKTKNIEDAAFKGCENLSDPEEDSSQPVAGSIGRQRYRHLRPSGKQRLLPLQGQMAEFCFYRR